MFFLVVHMQMVSLIQNLKKLPGLSTLRRYNVEPGMGQVDITGIMRHPALHKIFTCSIR